MTQELRYIYCIVGCKEQKSFGPLGIGGQKDDVYTIPYDGVATVVSDSPKIKYPITRENTLAHQSVMEEVMRHHTVLPVKFDTIAESKNGITPGERIIEKVLKKRTQEFQDLLKEMGNKIELGVKALWKEMDIIYGEIVKENEKIRTLKNKIAAHSITREHDARVKLGEMVKSALEAKKKREGNAMFNALEKLSVDYRENKTHGDKMVINGAFLVETERVREFDDQLTDLSSQYQQRLAFKYVGPVPMCNFVEIVITWDD